MKKAILPLFVVLSLSAVSEACECVPRTPKEQFDAADMVFLGKVVALTQTKIAKGNATIASMQVERSWKGLRGIRTQVRDSVVDCQVGFEVGVR